LREVAALGARPASVVELGAGSCDHALRCARDGLHTTAVEYSGVVVAAARERARRYPGLPLEIVQADLFAYTARLTPGSVAGVYANSVFHFLSPDERRAQYRGLHGALVAGGVLAISFKAAGDALQRRGSIVEETAAGAIIEGDDRIGRLFVAHPDALTDEMRAEGYAVAQVIHWSVPGYNVADERGEFVGILGRRGSG